MQSLGHIWFPLGAFCICICQNVQLSNNGLDFLHQVQSVILHGNDQFGKMLYPEIHWMMSIIIGSGSGYFFMYNSLTKGPCVGSKLDTSFLFGSDESWRCPPGGFERFKGTKLNNSIKFLFKSVLMNMGGMGGMVMHLLCHRFEVNENFLMWIYVKIHQKIKYIWRELHVSFKVNPKSNIIEWMQN